MPNQLTENRLRTIFDRTGQLLEQSDQINFIQIPACTRASYARKPTSRRVFFLSPGRACLRWMEAGILTTWKFVHPWRVGETWKLAAAQRKVALLVTAICVNSLAKHDGMLILRFHPLSFRSGNPIEIRRFHRIEPERCSLQIEEPNGIPDRISLLLDHPVNNAIFFVSPLFFKIRITELCLVWNILDFIVYDILVFSAGTLTFPWWNV